MKKSDTRRKQTGVYVLGALYPDVIGGAEIFNYYFLHAQLENNKEHVFYLGNSRSENDESYFLPLRVIRPVRLFYPFQFFVAIFLLRKKINYAYLTFGEQSWIIILSQSIILRLFHIPYIVTIHWGKKPEWRFSYPYKAFFYHAFQIIGVSQPICDTYKQVLPQKEILFIPPLIPFKDCAKTKMEAKRYLQMNDDESIILYVGSLKQMKNPDKIIDALMKIDPSFRSDNKVKLIFVGGGVMTEDLKSLAAKNKLSEFIRFDGVISREEIPYYFKAADCYIISSDYEGTSISLLEAMFNKLPIIGANSPGINTMLTDQKNSLLYEKEDTIQLAILLQKILTDRKLADELAHQAYEDYIRKYSYENMIRQYRDIFTSAIK